MQQQPVLQGEEGDTAQKQPYGCTASLYQRYAPALFAYIRRHITALPDAEDILADVFIGALHTDLSKISVDEQRAWLWTVARYKVIDHYRRTRQQQPQIPLDTLLETLADATTPEKLLLKHEEEAYLRRYFQQLSEIQQEVLQLRFIAGLRCTEIAAILHKREGAVRSILLRALNTLRKHYQR
jgi:RNA polymerase sigma-70 factor (ECF subfamily)